MSRPARSAVRANARESLAILGVLAVGAALRLYGLGARSLWTDEGSTWTAATLPFAELVHRCLVRDASPPLYYLAVKAALRAADSESALRLVSALASLGLVWLTYRIARLAFARGTATLAALLCAVSPYQVMYAQEARTYALVALFSVGATYLYAKSVLASKRPAWPAFALVTAAGLWTQSLAVLALPAQGVLALTTPDGRRRLLPWLAWLGVALLLFAPWAWASRAAGEQLGSSHWYVPDPDAVGLFKVLRATLVAPMPLVTPVPGSTWPGLAAFMPRPLAWALLIVPITAVFGAGLGELLERGPRAFVARLAWAGWALPMLAVLVVSLRSPLFLARYFVFTTPYIAIGLAIGLARLGPPAARGLLGGLVLGASILGLLQYERGYTKEPWRDVAAEIRTHALPGRSAVLVPFDADPMAYYLRHDAGVRVIEVGHPDEPFAAHYTPRQLEELTAAADSASAPFDDVWVVVRSPNSDVRREVARRANAVGAQGRVESARDTLRSYGGPLVVARFIRSQAAAH